MFRPSLDDSLLHGTDMPVALQEWCQHKSTRGKHDICKTSVHA